MDQNAASNSISEVIDAVQQTAIVDEEFLETVLTGILGRGHVLIEDVPGTGKTLTARSLAKVLGLKFKRIQFTPDLLPSDITGSHLYNESTGDFEFSPGPIFSNIVLADEINRAPPKTQAALLEAMGEKQVTVDNETRKLPEPFFVIATQNPIEHEGTFSLPEAQRDRFMTKTSMGYPSRGGERELLDRRADRTTQTPAARTVIDRSQVHDIQDIVETVHVDSRLRDYLVDICRQTREDHQVETGVSPRGIQRAFEAARARALIQQRDYVVPDDVKAIAVPVLAHRLVLTNEAQIRDADPKAVINRSLDAVEVPSIETPRA
ncbi:AAA family ATPase [Haloferax profundi]|uniref:ATPase n=1 Tax=Haloferax profundi TaxID=1544718 RepID=A0A0W1SLF4_9EURY|nr:AAA family ATPase [Haloferax profundi]KTG27122.1 ATPase [Haloferax profundi]